MMIIKLILFAFATYKVSKSFTWACMKILKYFSIFTKMIYYHRTLRTLWSYKDCILLAATLKPRIISKCSWWFEILEKFFKFTCDDQGQGTPKKWVEKSCKKLAKSWRVEEFLGLGEDIEHLIQNSTVFRLKCFKSLFQIFL